MVPILSTLASLARGRTVLSHVAHAQLKESDRPSSMLQLRKMGAHVSFDGNDMEFEGVRQLRGASLSSFNDHRVQMALAIAGSTATGVTELSYPHAYRISYPEFVDHMNTIGIPIGITPRLPSSLGDLT
jgi:3-phosphoshikimate 1-carboxyvinyltransferase